jgi:hypothetical protein
MRNNLNYINAKTLTSNITNLFKKLNYLTLCLLLTLTSLLPILLPATATAAPSIPPDSCFDYTTNLGEVTITDYYDHESNNNANPACTREPIIPSTIGGNPVTSIGDYALTYNQLTSVTIPNSVTSIGNSAFTYNQLTSLTIPNSVTSIGGGAFSDNQLTSVTIEGNITTIGGNEFSFNPIQTFTYGLDTYTSSDPITEDCFAFDGSNTITGFNKAVIATIKDHNNACLNPIVNIPSTIGGNSVTSIGDEAFAGNQLTSVIIPNSVTSIGNYAFRENQLASVTIPNSVTSISDYAFFENNLSALVIPNAVTSIGSFAFYANKITEVSIPDSVVTIGDLAFTAQSPIGAEAIKAYNEAVINNDYSELNYLMSVVWYTKIYTSPSNPSNSTDFFSSENMFSIDMNSDGDMNDSFGGQLINPSRVTANYKDTNGNTIAPSTTATGTGLSSYLAVDNPTNNLSLYYKAGNSYTIPPAPSITGYTIQTSPSNIASLTAGNNSIDYIYTANSNNNNNEEGNNSSNTVDLTTPTSPISAFSLRPVSISTPTGTNITSSSTVPESSLVTQDNNNQYPLGLVNFSFTTNQSSNQVVLNFITDLKPNQVTPRKYNSNTNTYNNLPTSANPTITETTIDNKHALTLTYTLIDNGELDLDPTTGIVKDPVGLAVSNQTYDQLANTGDNNTLPIVVAVTMIALAGGIGLASKRGRVWV